ncbi:xanthine dehydrogenase family protein molybdopterin-binding subunit [Marinactinospora thermotolerans]|uniref:Xanthine dehydrogenase, molybdenum binding subunit apoprotein n=1 Tax=Marinactinospora thermotolerans DSM 45154 TaxID=1122192 RepID=A0A1T4LEP2_9ACTN|nr:xanthine dehydrogenase family protein molybdopterin-binding subunit [Marinactinospora thermotolerans]SJZ53086.1 xanthine dehydrogenase, molybdenum binding subunit apoprotein [Marinactinospora thermotolerans DSM 45154]
MSGLLENTSTRAIGADIGRVDGPAKVTGTATYAFEHQLNAPAYLHPIQATVVRGRVREFDTRDAEAVPGVLTVLTHDNAARLADIGDAELAVLQSDEVAHRGQVIGAVLAETPEAARQAVRLVRVHYEERSHDVRFSAARTDLYTPGEAEDDEQGDLAGAMASAPVTVDHTYTTPMEHNNPMEPHSTIAVWEDAGLTLYESTQGVHSVRSTMAELFGLDPERVRVIAPHVGGGFGSKGPLHPPVVLAALAARLLPGRPVKLALTRQQMFDLVGYRSPTIQRVRLAAEPDGRLTGIGIDVTAQTARFKEFLEQAGKPTEVMYAAPNRRITHRLAALDVAPPTWMRAPGECPGMFGPEVAMDELAVACGVDPVELRVRNEPGTEPASGRPFSSRNLVACLREGARRFGWQDRDPEPRRRMEDGWLVGTGVAASTYPTGQMPGSVAAVRFEDGHYHVRIGAADIGTGAWTVLTQIAADALGVPVTAVRLRIGDSSLPSASLAGGSTGTVSWGSTIVAAAQAFRERHGTAPADGAEARAGLPDNPNRERYAMHAFGAQFAEVRVHADTGEVRVPRLLGVFAAGRIVNPRTARSQFIGGMTMGLSMALHEDSVVDPRFGCVVNHDLAEYHIAANADVVDLQAHWIDEADPYVNPLGAKGIGEIGIVGTAAAIVNAAYHATGVRVRELPMTLEHFLA